MAPEPHQAEPPPTKKRRACGSNGSTRRCARRGFRTKMGTSLAVFAFHPSFVGGVAPSNCCGSTVTRVLHSASNLLHLSCKASIACLISGTSLHGQRRKSLKKPQPRIAWNLSLIHI